MKQQQTLLREILSDDELEQFRRHSLAQGLLSIQKHRRRRLLCRIGLSALAAFVILLGISRHRGAPGVKPHFATAYSSSPADSRPVEIITDDELLALFPDRDVALVGKPGRQTLLFLNQSAATEKAEK